VVPGADAGGSSMLTSDRKPRYDTQLNPQEV